jgi:hypothetical protein
MTQLNVSINQEFIIFQQLKSAIKTFDNLINTSISWIRQLPYCPQNYLCSSRDFGSCLCFISSNSKINSKWFGSCFKFVWSSKLSNWYHFLMLQSIEKKWIIGSISIWFGKPSKIGNFVRYLNMYTNLVHVVELFSLIYIMNSQ